MRLLVIGRRGDARAGRPRRRRAQPATRWSASTSRSSTSPTPPPPRAAVADAAPGRGRQLRGLDRRRRRGGARGARRRGSTARAPGTSRPPPRRPNALARPRLDRLRPSTATATEPYPESEPDVAARRLRAHQARRRAGGRRGGDARLRDRAHLLAVRPARQELRRHDAAPRRRARRASPSSTTRSAAPPTPATSRARSWRSPSGGLTGILHVAGGGACSWYDLAVAAFEAAGADCVRSAATTAAEFGRPAPRPAYSVLRSERDDTPRLPAWQDGLAAHRLARSRRGRRRMRLLVCGGAGFIGSNFARMRAREHGDEVDGAGQAHLRGPRGEPRGRRAPLRARRDRGPRRRSPRRSPARTRSSTSRPRRTSTARSPSPTRS